jgi:hypothetical protein
VRTELQCQDPEAALRERACGLAGARPDLDDRGARLYTGQLHKVVEDARRRCRSGAVIRLDGLVAFPDEHR